jgi:hypothetical protein
MNSKEEYGSVYKILAPIFKADHPVCEANLDGCTHKTVDIHHRARRDGIRLIMECFFLAVCRHCHDIIGVNSKMAFETGLSLNAGHFEVTSAVRLFKLNYDKEAFLKQLKERK